MQRSTLDPKLDVVFKRLFSDPRNRELLCNLLAAVLKPTSGIGDVEVLNPVLPGQSVSEHGAVLDLLVRFRDGKLIHVEMQARKQAGFLSRGLFYWARAYTSQLVAGQSYSELAPTVGIFILDYVELATERYHSSYEVRNACDGSLLCDDLMLHFIELPKLPGDILEGPEVDSMVKWGKFLRARTDEQLERLAMTDPLLQQAKQALELLSGDPIAREEAIKRAYDLGNQEAQLNRLRQQALEARQEAVEARQEAVEARQEALEALEKGREEGERAILRRLIERKYGKLTPQVEVRLASATKEELGRWAERTLTASALEEILE